MEYTAKTFNIPALDGISDKTMQEHMGLYQGYVKNFNALTATAEALMPEGQKNALSISELWRRRSFEFDGMRLHEYYFEQLEGGAVAMNPASAFAAQLRAEFPMEGADQPQMHLKNIGLMRGPGWAILYWDPIGKCFQSAFVGEQHQGHFAALPIVLALDVWEHAFILDQGAQGKGAYIDAFFKNLNWGVVENRFAQLHG